MSITSKVIYSKTSVPITWKPEGVELPQLRARLLGQQQNLKPVGVSQM